MCVCVLGVGRALGWFPGGRWKEDLRFFEERGVTVGVFWVLSGRFDLSRRGGDEGGPGVGVPPRRML